jgi:RNA polymerase sigma-70 factor (sigma-E family)
MSVENGAGSTAADDAVAFHEFFERHYAELARLAHLLTGEADAADDLAADALVALWRHWDRVRSADHPTAYARGVVANLARSRIRSAVRERRRVALFWSQRADRVVEQPDVPAVLDLRQALQRLPFRKRACVVLRHAFDLSEKDTAAALGISVGTVKSQTSRGVAELERLLAQPAEPPAAPRPPADGATAARSAPRTERGATDSLLSAGRSAPGADGPFDEGPFGESPVIDSSFGDGPVVNGPFGESSFSDGSFSDSSFGDGSFGTHPAGGLLVGQPPSAGSDFTSTGDRPAHGPGAGPLLTEEQPVPPRAELCAAGGPPAAPGADGGPPGELPSDSEGERAADNGSAPATGATEEVGATTRILGAANPATRPRTQTGRGM